MTIEIQTARRMIPMIYAYTTPEIARHNGWCKIGYTESQSVMERIEQQTHTADVRCKLEWQDNALYSDGSQEAFMDKDFHRYLQHLGVEVDAEQRNEWFHISPQEARLAMIDYKANRGQILLDKMLYKPAGLAAEGECTAMAFVPRSEQARAIEQTEKYYEAHCNDDEPADFLWNAKPRFGKTATAYAFCQRVGARHILIVTNRPSIASSWYADYIKFVGANSGYNFVSESQEFQTRRGAENKYAFVTSRKAFVDSKQANKKCIEFVSLQDLKGSIYFGGEYEKLQEVAELTWDILIVDEAHEGVDTFKTDVAFENIKRKFTLHLSGTPFKALADGKFSEDAIFNWSYADEQRAKAAWDTDTKYQFEANPYEELPRLNLFTYQMSEMIRDEIDRGIELNGETEEYAFDLNEFFATDGKGKFKYERSVDRFLDALTTQNKYPFSTETLRNELKHSLWLLNHVDSAKALAEKLSNHPVFQNYKVVVAAGDGRSDDEFARQQTSLGEVREAISKYDKTITISVGQLTTGITIPEWTGVLMLCNLSSPAKYIQAAFRAQNPCVFRVGAEMWRKTDAYVFDFDPARTLTIYEAFANDLSQDTVNGGGDVEKRESHIRELLNFFPVVGEDDAGEMIELDAAQVLSVPRKIRSEEVVKRGFMSDFLFQNISNVFHAPAEVMEILKNVTPVKEPSQSKTKVDLNTPPDVPLNESGEVEIPDEIVIGKAEDAFGPKIYAPAPNVMAAIEQISAEPQGEPGSKEAKAAEKAQIDVVKKAAEDVTKAFMDEAGEKFGSKALTTREKKQTAKKLNEASEAAINKVATQHEIKQKEIESERKAAINQAESPKEIAQINAEFDQKQRDATNDLKDKLISTLSDRAQQTATTITEVIEAKQKCEEKRVYESGIRDHLRGFSRTIPAFLMAYGTSETTLDNFDTVIPDAVFKDVTSITLEQFRFLRDGGDYVDAETKERKHFDGHLFEPIVFNDSVKAFLKKKRDLANYFDESQTEDIFNYIPPQKTNQIFTPRKVVEQMIDALEAENPGCFDDPTKTFADLYMKSGLYITEIVKRLYHSEGLKRAYPEDSERIRHIIENQVYGMAPTEIIYKIATNYILGFDESLRANTKHFVCADAATAAKDGNLQALVDQYFDNK